ncbi:uncharacterized protein LOC141691624 [Apium graveolens]|uniref:uncharacterized protein LOC141691624 n=1 Tax=Apium graveolens TaxID=4045 RepID=UPI003D79D96A
MVLLIQKKDGANSMKDMRTIALCNVLYKIIAKLLSNRLRVLLTVSFNYDKVGLIATRRGLRQGDPLSPYLFLICVEGLSWSLKKAAEQGNIKGCRIHVEAPAITHLLFVDDSYNFLSNPSSLVARVFKARYFINTSLFEASRGGGVSFVWSGFWQAKEVLKKGYKWVLGNGEDMRVFKDSWVRGKENYMVNNMFTGSSIDMKVCELLIPGKNQRDTSKVFNHFIISDAKAILAIPIPRNQILDHISLIFTNDGKYDEKSGYKFWDKHFSECKWESKKQGWMKL